MPQREASPGLQLSILAAKGAGLAVTSNPFGAALSQQWELFLCLA